VFLKPPLNANDNNYKVLQTLLSNSWTPVASSDEPSSSPFPDRYNARGKETFRGTLVVHIRPPDIVLQARLEGFEGLEALVVLRVPVFSFR
jgi:hypothetical protein